MSLCCAGVSREPLIKSVVLWIRPDIGGGGRSRTGVREPSAFGSTCLAVSLNLATCYPKRRGNAGNESLKI